MQSSEELPGWKDFKPGAVVTDAGSARSYKTGDWRSQRPTYDFEKCIKCGFCYLFCPEGCIHVNDDGFMEADLYHCKGCGICAHECPMHVVTMVED